MKMKLIDVADVIRSKNSGPFELTFDIMFKDTDFFQKFVAAKIITPEIFAELYGISTESILSILDFPPAKAVKITIIRPIASGNLGEKDVYGAQQHRPLLSFEFDSEELEKPELLGGV
ncbi:MAG: DUF4387 domain-containing protein [Defluviitaleaceae bacterium]|nr:DUF4387 domain-containing protein [Defluviitaleaceae bacterium]